MPIRDFVRGEKLDLTPEIAQSPCGAWALRRGSASSAKGLDEPDTRDQTDEKERNWINDTPLVMAAKGGRCDAVRHQCPAHQSAGLLGSDHIESRRITANLLQPGLIAMAKSSPL